METRKICDRCKSSVLNDLSTGCESCGGTSFSYIRGIVSVEQSSSEEPNLETKFKIDKDKINWKILIGIAVVVFISLVTVFSIMNEVDTSSFAYRECLYNAKISIVPNTNISPNSDSYIDLLDAVTDLGRSPDTKACVAAFSDLQTTWNNNGGRFNLRNLIYLDSIVMPEKQHNSQLQHLAKPGSESENKNSTPASEADSTGSTSSSDNSTIRDSTPAPSASPRPIVCKPYTSCPVGSIGPAGCVVFYDAGTKQSWGRYLEVSIKDLPEVFGWCSSTDAEGINLETSKDIGSGYSNTQKIRSKCNQDLGNAGLVAIRYASGGLSDWFIPSSDELLKLSHSVAWKEIEPIANGFPIATSTQSETDFRFEYAIDGGTLVQKFGGPVVVPMVRAF